MASFSFGVSGKDYGTGYINSKGQLRAQRLHRQHRQHRQGDGVLGRMVGFSDFNIYDAIGTRHQGRGHL